MTNKSKKAKQQKLARAMSNLSLKPKKKKATPFSDAGAIVGQKLGSMFNLPYLGGVGKWLGSGIGQIFGSGDYQMVGLPPNYNVLTSSRQIPKFETSERTNIVCHREYIGDVNGTSAFYNREYRINPGNKEMFPWLSSVAQNYQQYRIHGMIVEFRPLITDYVLDGKPGVVVMATNYNADAPGYRSRIDMENSEYAVSVKPTMPLVHAIECSPAETPITRLYVSEGEPPSNQDYRLYDLGKFQFATQANSVTDTIGELWVSYCIEFFKPVLDTTSAASNENFAQYLTINGSTYTSTYPLGNGLVDKDWYKIGGMATYINGVSFGLNEAKVGEEYNLYITWGLGTAATVAYPSFTGSRCTVTVQNPNLAYYSPTPGFVGATSAQIAVTLVVTADSQEGFVGITFGTSSTLPAASPVLVQCYKR
jgi:hypothetical protein